MAKIETENGDGHVLLRLANTTANTIDTDLVEELSQAIRDAARAAPAAVLAGGGKFFSNGLDLDWALGLERAEMETFFARLGGLILTILRTDLPIVAAVRGHAVGAAKTLVCACDYRYAATGRVLVGVPEIMLGVPNPNFADILLRFLVGDRVATDLVLTGRLVPAEDLVAAGLFHNVFDSEAVESEALERARTLGQIHRPAFAQNKQLRTADLCARIETGMDSSIAALLDCWFSAEAQTLLNLAAQPRQA